MPRDSLRQLFKLVCETNISLPRVFLFF